MKAYLTGSAVIIAAWVLLIAFGFGLNHLTSFKRDVIEITMQAFGFLLLIGVIRFYQINKLAFRHCLPVAVIVLGSFALFYFVEYF